MPHPQLHLPSSPVRSVVGFVSRWRGGRATLSLEARRARSMVIAAGALAVIVLLTSFPISGLLSQRASISGTAHEISTVQAENDVLSRQVSALSDSATIDALARHDYGFVPKGQRVYDILPSPDASGSALAGSGQVPLDGPPVVPGSAQSQALIGVVTPAGSNAAQAARHQRAPRWHRGRRRRGQPGAARAPQLLGTGGPQPRVLELTSSSHPPGESDHDAVTRLLGRPPSGAFTVVVRRRDGAPVVIENAPLLEDGRPMPTRFWLVDGAVRDAVSALEAAGGVKRAEAAVDRSSSPTPTPGTRPSATSPCRPGTADPARRGAWGGPAPG